MQKNLVRLTWSPKVKGHMDVHYKTRSFYLVTSLPIYLKGRMTCANYHFNETIFPPLGGEKPVPKERREIICNALTLPHLDPHTNQCELEVQGSFIYKILQINCKMHSLIQRK